MCRKVSDQNIERKESWVLGGTSVQIQKVLLLPRRHYHSPRSGCKARSARFQFSLAPNSGNFIQWTTCRIISTLQKQRSANYSPNVVHCLHLYDLWAKNCFCILNGNKNKRTFHDQWKWHEFQIPVSTSGLWLRLGLLTHVCLQETAEQASLEMAT